MLRKSLRPRRIRLGSLSVSVVVLVGICVLLGAAATGVYALLAGGSGLNSADSVDLQKGLVGWWKLDGNAKDSTPFRQDGAVNGSTMVADRKGKANGAYSFNSSSQYVRVTPSNFPTDAITVSMWVNQSTWANWYNLFANQWGVNGGWLLYTNSGGTLQFGVIQSGSQRNAACLPGGSVTTSAWHLMTGTYDGATVKVYLDGSLCGSITAATPLAYGAYAQIGNTNTNGSTHYIDDVRVYNRAVSASEVKALYDGYDSEAQVLAGESGMLARWTLDGTVGDRSPYRNKLTLSGTTYVNDRKGKVDGAMSFNGTSDYAYAKIGDGSWFGGNNALTAMGWVYASATSNGPVFGVTASPPNSGWNMPFLSISGTTVYGWIYNLTKLSATVTPDQWHHLALTYQPGGSPSVIFYVDGVQVATTTGVYSASGTIDYFTTSITGTKPVGVNTYLNTPIDDIRAYKRALPADEIAAIFNSYDSQVNLYSAPTNGGGALNINSGLVAYWAFNGNAKDSTPNRHNGTLVGSPSYVTDRAGKNESALGVALGTQWMDNVNIDIGNDWSASVWSPYPNNGLEETGHWRTLLRGNVGDHQVMVQSGTYVLGSYDNTGGTNFRACTPTFNVNTLSNGWHNFTVTQSGGTTGTMIFYVDGTERCRINGYGSTTDIRSVDNYWGGGQEWGTVDDVRIYNRTLSPAEVTAIYTTYQ